MLLVSMIPLQMGLNFSCQEIPQYLFLPQSLFVISVRVLYVEPVLKDHPIGHKNIVSQDRWSLVTCLVILKCSSFWQKCVVFQDRWSLMAVVSRQVSLYFVFSSLGLVWQQRSQCFLDVRVLLHASLPYRSSAELRQEVHHPHRPAGLWLRGYGGQGVQRTARGW